MKLSVLILTVAASMIHALYARQNQGVYEINCDSAFLKKPASIVDIISTKNIVGLGEATHGTHEFFTIKGELIKSLVLTAKFKTIAFETDFSAFQVNEYLIGNSSDLAQVMTNFYLIYHTEEFVSLLRWLRDYNMSVSKENQVLIFGYDSQHVGNLPKMLIKYLEKVDPVYSTECEPWLAELQLELQPKFRDKYTQKLDLLAQRAAERKSIYLEHCSAQEYKFAVQMISRMKSAVIQSTMRNRHGTKSQTLRDAEMLENLKWIRKFTGDGKVIIWGHNGHIQTNKFILKNEDHFRMGEGLKEHFGTDYYAVGFDFGSGSFNAVNYQKDARMQPCFVSNTNESSLSAQLKEVGLSCYFIDFSSLSENIKSKLSGVRYMREAGIGFSGEQFTFARLDVASSFDAIVYVNQTNPTKFVDVRKLR